MEHFCTLFDSGFLPQGLALYASLRRHANPFVLWVLCMDEVVENVFKRLAFPEVRCISLQSIETPQLLSVKEGRSGGEYCWTLTPFLPKAVMDLDPTAQRVTYIDADCYFFNDPRMIFQEMDDAKKDALITSHDYMPQYDQSATSGIFCVQFMPFRRTDSGLAILSWWQERCLDWCFARFEDGKFGDQKYLDHWPELFPHAVHVLQKTQLTLAPWNALRYFDAANRKHFCMYHFQNLRVFRQGRVFLNNCYYLPRSIITQFYQPYVKELSNGMELVRHVGTELRLLKPFKGVSRLKSLFRRLFKNEVWRSLPSTFPITL